MVVAKSKPKTKTKSGTKTGSKSKTGKKIKTSKAGTSKTAKTKKTEKKKSAAKSKEKAKKNGSVSEKKEVKKQKETAGKKGKKKSASKKKTGTAAERTDVEKILSSCGKPIVLESVECSLCNIQEKIFEQTKTAGEFERVYWEYPEGEQLRKLLKKSGFEVHGTPSFICPGGVCLEEGVKGPRQIKGFLKKAEKIRRKGCKVKTKWQN